MSDEKEMMQKLIEDSVVLIVKTSSKFKAKVEIRGVICITADQGDVTVVHIDQNLQTEDMIKKEMFQDASEFPSSREQQTPAKKIKLDNKNTESDIQLSFTDDLDNQSFFQIQNYNSARQATPVKNPSSSSLNNNNNLQNVNSENNYNNNSIPQNNNVKSNLIPQNNVNNNSNSQNTNFANDMVFQNNFNDSNQLSEDTQMPVKTQSNANLMMNNVNNQVMGASPAKKPVDVNVLVKQLLQQQNQQKAQKQNIPQQNLQLLPLQQSPFQQQPHQQQFHQQKILQSPQSSKMFKESPSKNNQMRMLHSPMSMQSPSKPRGMLMQANPFRQQHSTPPNQKMQLQLVESHQTSRGRGKSPGRGRGRGKGEGWWSIEEVGAGGDGYSFGKQTVVQYVCNICKGTYNSHSGLLNHQVRNHGRQKKVGVGRKPKNQSSSYNGADQMFYEDDGYYQEDGYEGYEYAQ